MVTRSAIRCWDGRARRRVLPVVLACALLLALVAAATGRGSAERAASPGSSDWGSVPSAVARTNGVPLDPVWPVPPSSSATEPTVWTVPSTIVVSDQGGVGSADVAADRMAAEALGSDPGGVGSADVAADQGAPGGADSSAGTERDGSPVPTDLAPLLKALVDRIDPNGIGTVAITVVHDGAVSTMSGDEPVVSASAAKLYWTVAAAARVEDVEALAADAEAVFGWSDNEAAGRLIDAAGGIDAVNAYTDALGLDATSLSGWPYGVHRVASDRADRGTENLTSTADLAGFLAALASGALLDADSQSEVEAWLRRTPDDLASSPGLDALVTDRLPGVVAAETMHKAGWLPPGCCRALDHVVVAAGVVPLGEDAWFSIAAAAQDAPDFTQTARWISEVVCEVYGALSGQGGCDTRERTGPATQALAAVSPVG